MAAPVSVDERTFRQLEELQKKLAAEEAERGGGQPVDATAAVKSLIATVERNVPSPGVSLPALAAAAFHRVAAGVRSTIGGHALNQAQDEAQDEARNRAHGSGGHNVFEKLEHALHGIHLGAGGFEAGGVGGFAAHVFGNVGQFEEVFKALGPVMGPAVAGIGALGAAALEASKALVEIRQTSFATGGTSAEVHQGRALAAVAGLDPNGIAGLAHGFRQQIATNELAMGRFAPLGIRELRPGFGTPPDEMKALLKGIEAVIHAPSDAAARRLTEVAPMLEPFGALRGNEEALRGLKELADEAAKLATPQMQKNAFGLRVEQEKLSMEWEHLTLLMGGPFLKAVEAAVGAVSATVGMFSGGWKHALHEAVFGPERPKQETAEAHKTVAEKQLEEAKKQTSELQALRQGTFGGGSHARSAIPAGLRGQALEQALNAQATRLGAF